MRTSLRLRVIGPLAGCCLAGTAGADEQLVLRFSGNPDYPPYHWCQRPDLLTGASVAQLRQVLPANVKLIPQAYPWKRVLLAAEQGQLDLILPLRINAERARYLRFSQYPAFENPIVVFVRQAKPIRYQSWESLKPYRGGISLGDVFGDGFDDYLAANLTVEVAPDMESNFKKLALGRIDYFITGRYVGMAYLKKQHLNAKITDLPIPVSVSKIHFGYGSRVPASLIEDIDRSLKKMADSGASTALLKKWLGRYAESKADKCL